MNTLRNVVLYMVLPAALGALFALLIGCAPSVQRIALQTPAHKGGYEQPTSGDSHAVAYNDLTKRIAGWGVSVAELDDEPGAPAGLSNTDQRVILINRKLPTNGKLETLAHEAAHLLQTRSVKDDWALSEVAADVVSHRVLLFYGLDNRRVSGTYLAKFKQGFAGLPFIQTDIDWAVRVLTGQEPFEGTWK